MDHTVCPEDKDAAQSFDLLPEIAWTLSCDQQILVWNAKGRQYFGMLQEAPRTPGQFFLAPFVEAADLPVLTQSWSASASLNGPWEAEVRLKRTGGSLRWHLLRARLCEGAATEPCWLGTATDIHSLKLRELDAMERREHYRSLVDNSSQSIWRFAMDEPVDRTWSAEKQIAHIYAHGFLAECNDTMARTYGYDSPAEMVGARLGDLLPAENPANIAMLNHAIQSNYHVCDVPSIEVDRNGKELHFLNSFTAEGDKLWSAWGTSHDITRHVMAERALRESEERFQRAAEMGRVGIWELDIGAQTLFISRQLKSMLGYKEDEVDGDVELWSSMVHPEDFEKLKQTARDHMEGRTPLYEMEARRRHKDGHYLWFLSRGTIIRDDTGRPVKLTGADTDVTALRAAQEALRESENRLSLIYHNSSDCLCLLAVDPDRGYVFLSANKTFLDTTGYTAKQIHGAEIGEILPEENRVWERAKHEEAVRNRRPVVYEVSAAVPSGQRHAEVTLIPIMDATGTVTHLLACIKDMTQHKETEHALQQARDIAEAASKSKDRFMAVVSHELRTPLTPVLLTVSAMEEDPMLPEGFREVISMVRRNVELEARLIDDLLDLSRISSGKLRLHAQPINVNDTLRHVLETCDNQLAERDIGLHMDLHPDPLTVNADPARLLQVFWNVLKNAIKFTPEGGDIFVRSFAGTDGRAVVEIRDTGIGIEKAHLPLIFDAFHQGTSAAGRECGGLGLGLAIGKAVIELHQGNIRAESAGHGQGSTFTMELPSCAPAPVEVTAPVSKPAASASAASRLLLVEDHADTAKTLGRLLTSRGYQVTIANSVTQALEVAANGAFDLIVSDIGLPDGNGYDLMRKLQEICPIKGIAMSGYGMEEDLQKGRDAGFLEHLVKPVKMASLISAISRVLGTEKVGK